MSQGRTVNQLVEELQRRHVFRVAASYAIVAWVLLQLAEITFPAFQLSDAALRSLVLSAVAGFPITLLLAWLVEGKMRSEAADGESVLPRSAEAGIILTVLALSVGIGFAFTFEDGGPATDDGVPSIAVMPFVDLSADRRYEYFGDGIAEELLNVLARVDGLQVAARTSSFAFKGTQQDIRAIGRELSVGTVLEGSVRGSGDTVRITAQLIDVETGFHLWSETYDRQWDDVFAIQDEISASIVEALHPHLLGVAGAEPVASLPEIQRETEDALAYQLVLEGRFELYQRTAESIERGLELFRQAVEADPDYVAAYAGLADAYILSASYGNLQTERSLELATRAVAEALSRDDQRAEVYASLGLIRNNQNRWDEAEALFQQAIALDPEYTMAHMWRGNNLGNLQRFEEQLEAYRRAYELDPLSKPVNVNMANQLANWGLYDELHRHLEKLIRIDPERRAGWQDWQARTWSNTGDLARAVDAFRDHLAEYPSDISSMRNMVTTLIALGDLDEAEVWVQRAERMAPWEFETRRARWRLQIARGELATMEAAMEEVFGRETLAADQAAALWQVMAALQRGDDAAFTSRMERLREAYGGEFRAATGSGLFTLPLVAELVLASGDRARAEAIADVIIEEVDDQRAWFGSYLDDTELLAEAVALAIQGRDEGAVLSLEDAVEGGWRAAWILDFLPSMRRLGEAGMLDELRARIAAEVTIERAKYDDALFAAYVEPEPPRPVSLPRSSFASVLGYYELVNNTGNKLRLFEEAGNLYAQFNFEVVPLPIWPSAPDRFFSDMRSDRYEIVRDGQGQVTHLMWTTDGQPQRMRRIEFERPDAYAMSEEEMRRFEGTYDFEQFQVALAVEGGRPYVQQLGNPRVPVIPIGPEEFYLELNDMRIRFEDDGQRVVIVQDGIETEGTRIQ